VGDRGTPVSHFSAVFGTFSAHAATAAVS
jgi:hypothetical protein